jgi:hypothetical protein
MHVGCLFPHTKTVHNFVCGVVVGLGCNVASRASEICPNCTQHRIDGWSFHVFLANATIILYLCEITPSASPIFCFINFVKSVRYCSCSSLGMRLRNGLTAFRISDINKHKNISKWISYYIPCLMTAPGHSYVAGGVTH